MHESLTYNPVQGPVKILWQAMLTCAISCSRTRLLPIFCGFFHGGILFPERFGFPALAETGTQHLGSGFTILESRTLAS